MAAPRRLYTLVFVFSEDDKRLLLGMKKRGFGVGRFNGFGGKVEARESPRSGAARELFEETGIQMDETRLGLIGFLEFHFEGVSELMAVHVFVAHSRPADSLPVETEEMAPTWFPIEDLPFNQMWPDDKFWFPFLLDSRPFRGHFSFQGHDRILHHDLQECPLEELIANLNSNATELSNTC